MLGGTTCGICRTLVEIARVHFVSGKAYAIRASPGGVIMK
jgi:hypothetical protein